MRLMQPQKLYPSREHSQSSISHTKRRGISLSREKRIQNHQQTSQLDSKCFTTERKKQQKGSRNASIDRFIIYNVDRDQWQRNRNHQSHSKYSQSEVVKMYESNQNHFNHVQNLSQFKITNNLPTQQSVYEKNRQKKKAKEIRNRLTNIENKLNSLLETTKFQ